MRYPVLWEAVSPTDPGISDWPWHDARLNRLRELQITPIVGLVHHGSGPAYTNLLDPDFPAGLARHAKRVAERYPWITMFTPVNEPLTTARFSALYGHWYPHTTDPAAFLRALVNQCSAVMLAMQAIRGVTPQAQLVQTEDLGRTFSTPRLRYQADHDNERRWLSFDLLTGRVDESHGWYAELLAAGIPAAQLQALCSGAGTPDIIGLNHYLTSDRYLDERLRRYPKGMWGGNDHCRYADVEAVRMRLPAVEIGPEARLHEAWDRYKIPIAITEAHHGCTREEQVRWLNDVWQAALRALAQGVDVRAVTIWSLFGAVDWNSLLTRRAGFYEPGAFDTRSDPPRPTALAKAAASFSRAGRFEHPVLATPGWWCRSDRFYKPSRLPKALRLNGRPILITGAAGRLGQTLADICRRRGLASALTRRAEVDAADERSVRLAIASINPWAVVNAAGTSPSRSHDMSRRLCRNDNVTTAALLSQVCAEAQIPLVTFSSDHVFAGDGTRPYGESDPVDPRDFLGRCKDEAEALVARHHDQALIIRSGPFLSGDARSPINERIGDLAAGLPAAASDAEFISPVYLPDFAHAALDLLIDGERGIWHLAGGHCSLHDLVERAAHVAKINASPLSRTHDGSMTALASERARLLPGLDDMIDRWARENLLNRPQPPVGRFDAEELQRADR